jgi:hypothetical protein
MAIQFLNTGYFPDNAKLTFGGAPDFEIYHNSTTNQNFINSLLGRQLVLSSDAIYFQNPGLDEYLASFIANGAVKLYYDNVSRLETTSAGVGVSGALYQSSGQKHQFDWAVSNDYHIYKNSTALTFNTGGTYVFNTGDVTFAGDVEAPVYLAAQTGYSDGYRLTRASHDAYRLCLAGTQGLRILNETDSRIEAQFIGDGSVAFYGNVTTTGTLTVGTVNSKFGENQLRFNSASTAYIDHGTTSQNIKFRLSNSSVLDVTMLEITPSYLVTAGSIFVGADSTYDLGTTANRWANIWVDSINGGAVVPGSYLPLAGGTMTGNVIFNDGVQLRFGNSGADCLMYSDGSDTYIQPNNGNFYIYQGADDKDISFQCDDGSGGVTPYITLDGSTVTTVVSKEFKFEDNVKANFGTGVDLQIYHTGSLGMIDNQTGDLIVKVSQDDGDIIFQSDNGSGAIDTYIRIDGGQTRTEFEKPTQHLDNVIANFGSSSDMQIYHNATDSYILNGTGDLEIINSQDDGDIKFLSDDGGGGTTEYYKIDGGSVLNIFYKNVFLGDNVNSLYGNNSDLRIYHNGTDSHIDNYTGNLNIVNNTDDGDINLYSDDGSGSVTPYLVLDGGITSIIAYKDLLFGADSIYAKWGASQDLIIGHDGSNSKIENYTGHLNIIQEAADKDIAFYNDNGSGGTTPYLDLDGSGGVMNAYVELRFGNGIKTKYGASQDLLIYHDGNGVIRNQTGDLYIDNYQDDGDIKFRADDMSGSNTEYFRLDGGEGETIFSRNTQHLDSVYGQFGTGKDLKIYHDGSNSFIINDTGVLYIRNTADDNDICFQSDNGTGSTATYFFLDGSETETGFLKRTHHMDNVEARFGDGNDLKIYHDSSNDISFITNTNASGLRLKSDEFRVFAANGTTLRAHFGTDVELYHNDAKKLETLTTGVSITGDVGATTLTLTGKGTSAATVDGDGSTTLTTKGYVDSLITGATLYQGTWDPDKSLNSGYGNPNLSSASLQVNGYYYICSADGIAEPNGTGTEPDSWHTGDWVIWNDDVGSGEWQKIDNTTVLSGAGTGEYLARWTDSETLGDSVVLASGDDILIPRYVGHVGDTNTYFGFSGNDTIQFNTNGSERMRIHSSGNVAIGTTIDINALDVAGNINIQGGNGGYLTFNNGDANIVINNNGTGRDLSFKTYDGSSNAERMRIDKDGNVGIGTTAPGNKLHIVSGDEDTLRLEATSGQPAIFWYPDGSVKWEERASASTWQLYSYDESEWIFNLYSGKCGIGTTTPEKKLHVLTSTTDSTPQVLVQNSSSGDASLQFNISGTSYTLGIDNSDSDKFKISTSALGTNDRLSIDSSGAVTIGGTVTTGAITTTGTLTVNSGHVNIDSGYSFQWGDTHERIEQSDGKIEFFTNNTEQMTLSGSNLGIGTTTPDAKLDVNGGIIAGGKTTYTISSGSLTTTGTAVAGLSGESGGNGFSAGFIFTCFGGEGYQRIVYSCRNEGGTWNIDKDIDEGVNAFDVTYAADGSDNITFTFKARSSTQSYTPKVTVEAIGSYINQSYIN